MLTAKTTAAINALHMREAADLDRLNTPAVHRWVHKALSIGCNVEEIGNEIEKQAKCSRRVALIVARDAALAFRG